MKEWSGWDSSGQAGGKLDTRNIDLQGMLIIFSICHPIVFLSRISSMICGEGRGNMSLAVGVTHTC